MNDLIIKGTGNSRSIKSVANIAALAPTHEDLLDLLRDGLPVDIGPLNPQGVQQMGTANNTANLLSDATAAVLGLTGDPTVNDALNSLASRYGTCSTAAETADKAVTLAGFTLATGAVIAVKFTYGNTADAPTLNVNGTGAKGIVVYGTTAAGSGAWSAGEAVLFVYDGAQWMINSGMVLGTGSNVEMYTGSYIGDGEKERTLLFPKQPIYLMIQKGSKTSYFGPNNDMYDGFVPGRIFARSSYYAGTIACRFGVDGSNVILRPDSSDKSNPANSSGYYFSYIAFARPDGAAIA